MCFCLLLRGNHCCQKVYWVQNRQKLGKEKISELINQKKAVYKTIYPTNGVNFGVGMNWIFYNGLSSALYLVRIISEEPSFNYELEEDWECSSSCRSNYESAVKKYTPNNSFYLTFGYNF